MMGKNKPSVIFTILTIICMFSLAAIADQCGCRALIPEQEKINFEITEEESSMEEEISKEVERTEETLEEEKTAEETSEAGEGQKETEQQEQTEAPTIELEIYEGPVYSPSNDVCYYRIKANVTGTPVPDVEFSKDDSNGAWGKFKCQVNLNDPADNYTLKATATNSEGTDTDNITIGWGCEVKAETDKDKEEKETDKEEKEDEVKTIIVDANPLQTGTVTNIGNIVYLGDCLIGHFGTWDLDCVGYVSFNLVELLDKDLQSAALKINVQEVYESRYLFEYLDLLVVDLGSSQLDAGANDINAIVGLHMFEYDVFDIDYSGDKLLTLIKMIIQDGRTRLQLRLIYRKYLYTGNTTHGITFGADNAKLEITYID